MCLCVQFEGWRANEAEALKREKKALANKAKLLDLQGEQERTYAPPHALLLLSCIYSVISRLFFVFSQASYRCAFVCVPCA